jgi:hypothetical protein
MMEFLRHSLGLCGETHPSLLMFLLGELNVNFHLIFLNFKTYINNVTSIFQR